MPDGPGPDPTLPCTAWRLGANHEPLRVPVSSPARVPTPGTGAGPQTSGENLPPAATAPEAPDPGRKGLPSVEAPEHFGACVPRLHPVKSPRCAFLGSRSPLPAPPRALPAHISRVTNSLSKNSLSSNCCARDLPSRPFLLLVGVLRRWGSRNKARHLGVQVTECTQSHATATATHVQNILITPKRDSRAP